MPGQGRVDPVRMGDEVDDVVRALERDLPVLSHTPTTMLTVSRRLVRQPPGGTPRSVQDCGVESSNTEADEPQGDMPLGMAMAIQAHPRGPRQKMTQTMEKRQPHFRNQGRWQVWTKVLRPDTQNGIIQVTLTPIQILWQECPV